MGIAATIAIPSFVRSIRSQRLNTAARMLAATVRYARSMAVLKQTDLEMAIDLESGTAELVSSNAGMPGFSRVVDRVRLQEVTLSGDDPVTDGTCRVPFLRNGLCVPFEIKIADDSGNCVVLKVDALCSVKTGISESL